MIKKAAIFSLALTLILAMGLATKPAPVFAADVIKIGVLDLQEAINESRQGKAAKAKLVTKFERLQKELKREDEALQKMQKDFQKQAPMLSPDAKYQKEKTIARKVRAFQDKYRDYTEEMKKDEFQNTKPLLDKAVKIARALAKEKGLALLLEKQKSGIVYSVDALDITKEVIRRLDRGK